MVTTDLVISTYGDHTEIASLAKRIKIMVPGGNKLNDAEAQALAQVSLVTKCNPFIGEIWYIPGRGPMIGIKGARRHGNERIEEAGGKEAYWFPDLQPCPAEEAGARDVSDVAAAYRCTITDSISTGNFQKSFVEIINSLRSAGSTDPIGEAREILGKKPQWIGYGYSTISETSRMNKQALARKRAEADALKQKFDIPFGAEVAVGDTAIESEASDWIDTDSARLDLIGTENQETGEPSPAIELIDPMGDWAVKYAMEKWNLSQKETCTALASKKLGKRFDKSEFLKLINGE